MWRRGGDSLHPPVEGGYRGDDEKGARSRPPPPTPQRPRALRSARRRCRGISLPSLAPPPGKSFLHHLPPPQGLSIRASSVYVSHSFLRLVCILPVLLEHLPCVSLSRRRTCGLRWTIPRYSRGRRSFAADQITGSQQRSGGVWVWGGRSGATTWS